VEAGDRRQVAAVELLERALVARGRRRQQRLVVALAHRGHPRGFARRVRL
jgi:hypothetical protein